MLTSRISYDRPTGTAGRRSTMNPCARAASVQASPSKAAPTAATPTHRAPRVFMAVPLLTSFAGFMLCTTRPPLLRRSWRPALRRLGQFFLALARWCARLGRLQRLRTVKWATRPPVLAHQLASAYHFFRKADESSQDRLRLICNQFTEPEKMLQPALDFRSCTQPCVDHRTELAPQQVTATQCPDSQGACGYSGNLADL